MLIMDFTVNQHLIALEYNLLTPTPPREIMPLLASSSDSAKTSTHIAMRYAVCEASVSRGTLFNDGRRSNAIKSPY